MNPAQTRSERTASAAATGMAWISHEHRDLTRTRRGNNLTPRMHASIWNGLIASARNLSVTIGELSAHIIRKSTAPLMADAVHATFKVAHARMRRRRCAARAQNREHRQRSGAA